jgi:hypothetical protein
MNCTILYQNFQNIMLPNQLDVFLLTSFYENKLKKKKMKEIHNI